MTMKDSNRKCIRCNASTAEDPTMVLHRFPKPGPSNMQRMAAWAKFCYPEEDWNSGEFQKMLYLKHTMLCSKHFPSSAFLQNRLHRYAVPSELTKISTHTIPEMPSQIVAETETNQQLRTSGASDITKQTPASSDIQCEEESRAILNSTQRRKFQNLIHSEQFCGLCFECDDGININTDLEIVSEDWSHHLTIGDIYCTVFNKCLENLPSKTICNDCTDQLVQSYTFTQKSKFITKLLQSCVEDLESKTNELTTCLKGAALESNICIFLDGNIKVNYEKIDMRTKMYGDIKITGKEQDFKCTLCEKKFTAAEILLTHYNTHSKTESHAHKRRVTHVAPTEKSEVTHAQTEKPNMTRENEIETMQCVMCLKDIEGFQDHNCEFNCSNCNEPSCVHFAYIINYRDQVFSDSEKTCLDCHYVCRSKEALIDHVNERHLNYRPYKCDMCGQNYHSKTAVQNHITHEHRIKKKTQNCAICGEDLEKKNIKRHMELHGPNDKYPCRICDVHYDSLRELRAHSRKHVGPFSTSHICGKDIRDATLNTHLESHGVVTCDLCQRSFENITLFEYHQKSHQDDVHCPKCNKMMNPTKLRQHLKSHLEPEAQEVKKQKNVKCKQCSYTTWNSILLECHMNRYHLKIKPYVCHICSKDFVGKHLLNKHIKSHTVDQNVICSLCGKKLANNSCLKNHLKLHTGEKNYPCSVCGERFRSASIMNVHKVKKHSEREAACPLCPRKFFTLVELRRHVIKIHWHKDTKFDPRELEGLENHYHLFHDGRRIRMGEEDVDFYLPC